MSECDHDFESNDDSEYCAKGCGEKWCIWRIVNIQKELEKYKSAFEVLSEANNFYGSEALYMKREVETDMNLTSAVFKSEYVKDNDLSKPNIVKSIVLETTARLKCDQGKRAQEAAKKARQITEE